jgi:hypothetical protein
MNAPVSHHAIIAALREEIDTLEETVRQLREELAPVRAFPAAWRLSPQQATVLSCIMAASPSLASFSRLVAALYQYREPADSADDMLSVLIFEIRKRLRAAGIEPGIRNVAGVGYAMAPAERDRLLAKARAEGFDPPWWAEARRMAAEGANFREIARALGKHHTTVQRVLKPEMRARKDEYRRQRHRRDKALRSAAEANKQEAPHA